MSVFLQIVLINLAVSCDNVGVIAMATRGLPDRQAAIMRRLGIGLAPVFTLLFRWSGQDQKRLRFSFALSAALFGWLNYTSSVWLYPTAQCLLMACGSMAGIAASGFVILYLYNGQRAARGKKFSQWFFYLFYPVHLLMLGVIRVMG